MLVAPAVPTSGDGQPIFSIIAVVSGRDDERLQKEV